jgi:PDZ domain/Aspartyl protease
VAVTTAGRSVALLACLAGCVRGTPAAPPPAVAVVPFDPYGGAIYVPAIVNGDSAWLMFDTGLSRTGLDRDWARSIGASPDTDTSATALVASLRLGDLQLDGYRTALYPLGGLSEASGRVLQGLVGHDVLHRFAVEIDYPTRRVRLLDAKSFRYAGPGTVVAFTPDADLPLLRAKIKARGRRAIPARLLLDTGASGLCLILTAPFVEQHGLASVMPAIEAPIGTGLVGELHGTIVRLQRLELGRLQVASPTTGLGGESKGFLGRTDIDGVIGNAVFEGSRLIVDYARRRIIIEPRVASGSVCDYDMSGLRLVARGPGLRRVVVDYVVPQSPSAEAGIHAGDELLQIDGRGVAEEDLSDVRKLLRVEGALHHLTLRRDADTIRVDVRLRRLL